MRSSYADLQQLKTTTPLIATGVNARHGGGLSPTYAEDMLHTHRERKGSLNNVVPVERIGHVDPEEPFREATEELNSENDRLTTKRR